MLTPTTQPEIRFDDYTLDLRTGELSRNGVVLKLQPQPAKVLTILAGRAGEVVSRRELAEQVWGTETYVDFEHGLPVSQLTNVIHVVVLYVARDYEASIEQAKKTLELYPQSWGATICSAPPMRKTVIRPGVVLVFESEGAAGGISKPAICLED